MDEVNRAKFLPQWKCHINYVGDIVDLSTKEKNDVDRSPVEVPRKLRGYDARKRRIHVQRVGVIKRIRLDVWKIM